ncbi:MAG TPA: M23 family metallopeptidase [Gemmatimonadaceae bacterium]|nr:M23 family metallopeptidase [Gemmatimonadaceae bacterium]
MRNTLTPAWTVIIVPSRPTGSPRRIGVRKRTVRLVALVLAAVAAVPWAWTMSASRSAATMADRLAAQQRLTIALNDTVQSLRAASLAERALSLPPVGMIMPVHGEITSRFSRSRFHPILQIFRPHLGVDLATAAGTRIRAPARGVVTAVGWRIGYGMTIELAHTGGVVTRYAHCRSALVQRGDTIAMGQTIGTVGATGLATAPHLHFEVLVHGTAVDPIQFIASTHLASPIVAAH